MSRSIGEILEMGLENCFVVLQMCSVFDAGVIICVWALVFLLISSVRCSLISLEKLSEVFMDLIFGE